MAMGDHVCTAFRMMSTTHMVEMGGVCWALHVFDVEGEEEDIGMFLSFGSRAEYVPFPDDFRRAVMAAGPGRGKASLCPGCRPDDMDEWVPDFTEWIRAVYASMPSPPATHDCPDVPEVVVMSLESMCRNSPEEDMPGKFSLN